jgi:hypothetical protein
VLWESRGGKRGRGWRVWIESGGQPITLTSGYRLYGAENELKSLAANPRSALDEVIRRFGREFSVNGGAPTKFIEHDHVVASDLRIESGGGNVTVSSYVKRTPVGGFDLSFIWAIDEDRYHSALSSN